MDAVSYSLASKQAQRIEKFIENPDSTSGIVTVPKTIASGETVTVPAGRVAVLPNIVVDGTLNIDGEVFIPSGSSVDFSNGIKVNGSNIALSIPTPYHLLEGNLSVSNEVITNGFGIFTYTGNSVTPPSINLGMDITSQWGNDTSETFGYLIKIKSRSISGDWTYVDSVRGITKYTSSSTTALEGTDANMFTLNTVAGVTTLTLGSSTRTNVTGTTYVVEVYQTTHRITGTTNHNKAYTCHYNPTMLFSIDKIEGSGLAGHEIPHHLGRKLGFVTVKNLTTLYNWLAYVDTIQKHGSLNTPDAITNDNLDTPKNQTESTTPINGAYNTAGNAYVIYGWTNSYYDEAGKLIGNYLTNIDGNGVLRLSVHTNVSQSQIIWQMSKTTLTTGDWGIVDFTRGNIKELNANLPAIESTITANTLVTTASPATYYRATDTSNVQINNAIIPLAHGVDSNGSKNSIVIANETITGLTYTQGKNYLYKTDTGYGVKPYEPRYLSSELVRRFAGEQPDYYDVDSNKWFNTDAGSELVTNGKFISNITGWTQGTSSTASYNSGAMRLTSINVANDGVYQNIATVVGREYTIEFSVAFGTRDTITIEIDNNRIASISTVSGVKYLTFVANNTTTKLEFDTATSATGQYIDIDYVSVYPAIIVPTIEITESRNYLNHIVHADQNGQVIFVEELPKIEYKNVIKANEFKGRNACTAKAIFDRTTYKLSGLYKIGAAINSSPQYTDFIFEEEMDNIDYEVSIDCSLSAFTSNAMTPYTINKTTKGFRVQHYNTAGGGSNPSMVSIIVFGGKN